MKIHSYPKVLAVGHRYIQDILSPPNDNVVIQEKIDGSQISFGVIDGQLSIRSKGAQIHVDAPNEMFEQAVKSIKVAMPKLRPGYIYRGEYLRQPKHNTLQYERTPVNHIIIFDIEEGPNKPITQYELLEAASGAIGFECVPSYSVPLHLEKIKALLALNSVLGGTKVEGMVIKNYDKITPDGKFMTGKIVSDEFKERHEEEWKKANPSKADIIRKIIESLKTEARYKKAVQTLRDMGQATNSPADIGNLLKIIHLDIEREEAEYIKDKLYNHAIGNIKRGVCGGFPEWYKSYSNGGELNDGN